MNMIGSQQHFAPPSRNTSRNTYGNSSSGGVGGGGGGGSCGGGATRRLARRNTTMTATTVPSASAQLSEIGAGDAPLPGTAAATDVVSDACKKMEGIKL